jgi:transcription-repair coupling factor (superfamily II helicase)
MNLTRLLPILDNFPAYAKLTKALDERTASHVHIEGVCAAGKAILLARLSADLGRSVSVVTYNEEQARKLASDLAAYGIDSERIAFLPSSVGSLLYTDGAADYSLIGHRLSTVRKIANGEAQFVIGDANAWLQRTAPRDMLMATDLKIAKGETFDFEDLQRTLMRLGYERVEAVELPGQWTRRGGIVDVFPVDAANPVRLDFFGDDLEAIRLFSTETQLSVGERDDVVITPAREMPYPEDDKPLKAAIDTIRREVPGRCEALLREDLDGRGDDHAEHLRERIDGDLAQMAQRSYFDQAEAYLSYLYPEPCCLLDFLDADGVMVLDEPQQIKARWEQSEREMGAIAFARAARGEWLKGDMPTHCSFETLSTAASARKGSVVSFSLLARPIGWLGRALDLSANVAQMDSFAVHPASLFDMMDSWLGNRLQTVFVTRQPERVRAMLADRHIPAAPDNRLIPTARQAHAFVLDGVISGGFKIPDAGLMVISDAELFGDASAPKKKRSRIRDGMRIASYLELRVGDFVVHINHGIGVYRGITKLKGSDGAERDYLLLEYAGADRVYVPSDQVDRVQRYIGADSDSPTIHRLGGAEWQRATRAAQKQVQEMAAELIKLYAARKASDRPPYLADTPWQAEMEGAFPYEETPGQLAAIEDIKADLETKQPMDRLICGDVGYGKTEVAMRAAFKVVGSGRQVAVLAPTTILAQQHLNTFRERLAAYPVKVEMLSRFVPKADETATLKGLIDGTVDVVVGTHKLLGKTVKFHNLGLLIVDEEQRFGVAHKEKIKTLKKNVDVLTLTATPIPRTLHMALSGIRDLSVINDPPEGRLPIMTYVREYDDELVREVILRELDRNGQVYYVSNRVESITHTADHLRKLAPLARVIVGHGQMHEDHLEDVMLSFYHKEYDILVCTTIIESGLDVPNVNTIVVDNADRFGLAQLYQLRGRVGRSERQGYAYLLYRKNKLLSEVAEKRLNALKELSELGSGYKIALRDLEIRGAGNLLGREQSGSVAAVGFDLYTQLLSQAINDLKGEPADPEFILPSVVLPIDANIPTRYIPSEAERILIYKKLTGVRANDDVAAIQAELEDRYGDPPKSVWNLLALLRLRLRCLEVGIGSVMVEKKTIVLRFAKTHLPQESIRPLSRAFLQYEFYPDRVSMTLPETPPKMMTAVEEMVEILAKALPNKDQENRIGVSQGNGVAPKALRDAIPEGFVPVRPRVLQRPGPSWRR